MQVKGGAQFQIHVVGQIVVVTITSHQFIVRMLMPPKLVVTIVENVVM